jgi:hypothetical protein
VRRSPGGWKPAPQQLRASAREVGQSLNCRIDATRYKIKITVSHTESLVEAFHFVLH